MNSTGADPENEHNSLNRSMENLSTSKKSIFQNWDEYGADNTKFARQAYNEAI